MKFDLQRFGGGQIRGGDMFVPNQDNAMKPNQGNDAQIWNNRNQFQAPSMWAGTSGYNPGPANGEQRSQFGGGQNLPSPQQGTNNFGQGGGKGGQQINWQGNGGGKGMGQSAMVDKYINPSTVQSSANNIAKTITSPVATPATAPVNSSPKPKTGLQPMNSYEPPAPAPYYALNDFGSLFKMMQ